MARIGLGLGFVCSVVHGQLATRLAPAAWALGLIGFSALVLAWHWWHIRRHPAPFHDTSPAPLRAQRRTTLALYLNWWYAPAFSVTSDAALLFVGSSMVLAALRGYAGCEMLALSNWLLRRLHAHRLPGAARLSPLNARGAGLNRLSVACDWLDRERPCERGTWDANRLAISPAPLVS